MPKMTGKNTSEIQEITFTESNIFLGQHFPHFNFPNISIFQSGKAIKWYISLYLSNKLMIRSKPNALLWLQTCLWRPLKLKHHFAFCKLQWKLLHWHKYKHFLVIGYCVETLRMIHRDLWCHCPCNDGNIDFLKKPGGSCYQ